MYIYLRDVALGKGREGERVDCMSSTWWKALKQEEGVFWSEVKRKWEISNIRWKRKVLS